MVIMEDKSEEKEKTEDTLHELLDQNCSLGRPKNFSLQRRREVFYFSDESERGILKRVPVKHGAYEINELETVLEKSDAEKTRNEIWSDTPLNSLGNSKANKIRSVTKSDELHESAHHDKNRETVLKSREKIARHIPQSHGLNNVIDLGTCKKNSKTKIIPLNSLGYSKANKIRSVTKSDELHESAYHDKNRETVLKSREKIAPYIPQSHGLNIVADLGTCKKNSKTKTKCQDKMTANNQVRKENHFLTPFKEIKKKQKNVFVEIDFENLPGAHSDEKYKEFSASNKKSSSSKKPEDLESNHEHLIDEWTEKCLTDALSDIIIKTPITEL